MKTRFRSEFGAVVDVKACGGAVCIWQGVPFRSSNSVLLPPDIAIEALTAALALARGALAEVELLPEEPT